MPASSTTAGWPWPRSTTCIRAPTMSTRRPGGGNLRRSIQAQISSTSAIRPRITNAIATVDKVKSSVTMLASASREGKSRVRNRGKERQKLFNDGCADGGALTIMLAGIARQTNSANNHLAVLSVDDQGDAAFNRDRARQSQDADPRAAGCQGVLKSLGRTLEASCRSRLFNRDFGAAQLRIVHLLVVDQRAVWVYDGHCHGPMVLDSFCQGGSRSLLGIIDRDGWAVRIRQHLRSRSQETQDQHQSDQGLEPA